MATLRGAELGYLSYNPEDLKWGSAINFVVYQNVGPGETYPPGRPPASYNFTNIGGRTLEEYQITYISKGGGTFSCETLGRRKPIKLREGSMFILFPGEWHTYHPDPETGWEEYSIGFKGPYMGMLVQYGFYTPSSPVLNIGTSEFMRVLMEEALDAAIEQKPGYQQLLSGIVSHILGLAAYKLRNQSFASSEIAKKIVEAKNIALVEYAQVSPQDLAERVNLGYSSFRRSFKEYTGMPPAKFLSEIKVAKAKELLATTDLSIKEIAFAVGEDNFDYFTTNFKSKTGFTPTGYRLHVKGIV